MGPDDALQAVKWLKPKQVLPSHYDTFSPIKQDAAAWAQRVASETSSKATVLRPGETLTV
jgi:L-ascorbate metabolism protein UlaG (beta-lactamase superfamily)